MPRVPELKTRDPVFNYEYVRAQITGGGELTFLYRKRGSAFEGSFRHDEYVTEFTDGQIRELGCNLLSIDHKHRNKIQIIRT